MKLFDKLVICLLLVMCNSCVLLIGDSAVKIRGNLASYSDKEYGTCYLSIYNSSTGKKVNMTSISMDNEGNFDEIFTISTVKNKYYVTAHCNNKKTIYNSQKYSAGGSDIVLIDLGAIELH
jgi:hypothetical protein